MEPVRETSGDGSSDGRDEAVLKRAVTAAKVSVWLQFCPATLCLLKLLVKHDVLYVRRSTLLAPAATVVARSQPMPISTTAAHCMVPVGA